MWPHGTEKLLHKNDIIICTKQQSKNEKFFFFINCVSDRGLISKYTKNSKTIYQGNKQTNLKIVCRFKQRILKLGSLSSWQTLKEMFDMVIRDMQNQFLWDFTHTSQNGYVE